MPSEPRIPEESELPSDYDECVSIDYLERDPLNVRDERPSNALVEDIEQMGFMEPLVTRRSPTDDGVYLITDGWQRYQAGVQNNFTAIPINVYSKKEATRVAESMSRGKSWSKLEDIRQDAIRVKDIHQGENNLSRTEAIEKRVNECGHSRNTIRRNIKIDALPPVIKELIRKPENRPNAFHEKWSIKGCVSESDGTLPKGRAYEIAKRYCNGDIDESEAIGIAKRAVKIQDKDVLRDALDYVVYQDFDPKEAYEKSIEENAVQEEGTAPGYINVGQVSIGVENKKFLDRYLRDKAQKATAEFCRERFEKALHEEIEILREEYPQYKTDNWTSEFLK